MEHLMSKEEIKTKLKTNYERGITDRRSRGKAWSIWKKYIRSFEKTKYIYQIFESV